MLSPKILQSQIHIFAGVEEGECWQPTFDAESKNAKIPHSHLFQVWEGGGLAANFLMLSPEMLKSQIHIFADGRGGQQPTFDAESKNAKIPHSHFYRGRVGCQVLILSSKMLKSQIHIFTGGRGCQQPTFDAESRYAKMPNSHFCRFGKGRVGSQLLMLSPEMLKSQIYIFAGGGGSWWPTFDAESKYAKKSQIHIFTGGREGLAANF